MENFYVILRSNQSEAYFPNNSGSDFTVRLGKTYNFPPNFIEVGISQLYYTPPEPAKDENGNYIEFKQKFFGNVTGDNIIQVKGRSQSGFEWKKTMKIFLIL